MDRTIEAFVKRLAESLPESRGQADSSNTKRMKLSVLVRGIGLSRRSPKKLAELDAALKEAGIFCDHPLVERSLQLDTTLRFSRASFPPEEMLFESEVELKQLVMAHLGNYGPLRPLVLLGEEVRIGNCRVDLLCEEPSRPGRPLVIVEFKKGVASDRLAGQLGRYVDTIRSQPEFADRPLKFVVITAGNDTAVTDLLRARKVEVECYRYSVNLRRTDART